ncbi:Hypothetical_protein [Hexamita inflata]|uniref:Hypothetical_protein n=1 Tax=Hexamita inflata TaxID=28002 RepID=A0AA86QMA6_9EUKA|nr:Hypothetical protein HINF_LOCUS49866 [Hexamita inflata]
MQKELQYLMVQLQQALDHVKSEQQYKTLIDQQIQKANQSLQRIEKKLNITHGQLVKLNQDCMAQKLSKTSGNIAEQKLKKNQQFEWMRDLQTGWTELFDEKTPDLIYKVPTAYVDHIDKAEVSNDDEPVYEDNQFEDFEEEQPALQLKPVLQQNNQKQQQQQQQQQNRSQNVMSYTVMGGGIAFSCLLCEQLYIKIFCHFQCG